MSVAERNDTRDLMKYALILAQLAGALVVVYAFRIEDTGSGGRPFLLLMAGTFAAFAVHYWLPHAWKKPAFVIISLIGSYALLDRFSATALIACGLGFYAILHLPIAYWLRAGIVAVIGIACLYLRGDVLPWPEWNETAAAFWPVFGGLFMFRMMIYVYDLRQPKQAGGFMDYLTYFFILPNYYFLLFPVVDYQTMRSTYYSAEFHKQAQEGVRWIIRGLSQLMAYRLIYYWRPNLAPDDVESFGELVLAMVMTYLLYLRLSGQYHLIIGTMHLFGFNLPETHRRFLLASSFTDFWRRINIYWKDFMVKMFYFPAFFRLRKYGEMKATALATLLVFTLTWVLHSYQFYWLMGQWLLSWHDALFWGILGALVLVNVLIETRARPKSGAAAARKPRPVVHGLKVAATFATIVTLWSLWYSPSVTQWIDTLTWWKAG